MKLLRFVRKYIPSFQIGYRELTFLLSTTLIGTTVGLFFYLPKRPKSTNSSLLSHCTMVSWRPTLATKAILLTYHCPLKKWNPPSSSFKTGPLI